MKTRFHVTDTSLHGLRVVERIRIGDRRGYLERVFCSSELRVAGWTGPVAQINHTLTTDRGSVRGMHFQHPPSAEEKLVICMRGSIYDVAVDLRAGSATFLRWHGEELSSENGRAMLIPRGFAHGFQAMKSEVELLYIHSAPYDPAAEGGVHPADPRLGIEWPLPITNLSSRDAGHPPLSASYAGIRL
jgi:dTDP-4-dehydrorhamnose 3,5-epimerase